jgi:hypothetical protein
MQDCEDLIHVFGKAAPLLPVLLLVPGLYAGPQKQVILVAGEGYASAEEMKDLCVTTWGRAEMRVAERGPEFTTFDELRERHGLMPRNKVDAAVREALWERAKAHKTNFRTDPLPLDKGDMKHG